MSEVWVTEYRDGYVKSWWQPTLPTGERLWVVNIHGYIHYVWARVDNSFVQWYDSVERKPSLYRWRCMASWISKREYRRSERQRLSEVHEVKDND